jgi:hypothetical protein
MSKHTRLRTAAITAASAAMIGVGGSALSAGAASAAPATLSGVQAKAAAAITLRVDDLNTAISKVNGATDLGPGASALATYLGSDIAPLQALGQKIAADTTVAQAETDAATIFTDYRVLALVLPAARLAGDADRITATTIPTLTTDSAQASTRVDPANQAVLEPLITDLNAQIADATNSTSGLAATVLAYTPVQWNGNHDLLGTALSSLSAARGNISTARSDLQKIRNDLKSSAAAGTTTTMP